MADIAAADVTYTISKRHTGSSGEKVVKASVAFGNGVLTYPTGGVPLTKASLGCPTTISAIRLLDPASANGLVYKVDLTNLKIRVFQGDYSEATDGPLVELAGGSATPAAATLVLEAQGY